MRCELCDSATTCHIAPASRLYKNQVSVVLRVMSCDVNPVNSNVLMISSNGSIVRIVDSAPYCNSIWIAGCESVCGVAGHVMPCEPCQQQPADDQQQ